MYILGISCYYHDSAACLLYNDEIIAAAQEERFTRRKNDDSFPQKSIEYCLKEAGIDISVVSAISFYDKPLLKFERLLESQLFFVPKSLPLFIKSIPVWLEFKLFLERTLKKKLKLLGWSKKSKLTFLYPEHHLSHAASAYYTSGFDSAAIVTLDGVGEWCTSAIFSGKGPEIKKLRELNFPNSLGLLYSAFTYFLGFEVNEGEYKLMGLSSYGNIGSGQVDRFKQIITGKLCEIFTDGSIYLNQEYYRYGYGLRMIREKKWESLLGFKRRKRDEAILQIHCDLALAIQQVTELIVERIAQTAKEITGESRVCLAGGVALNGLANAGILNNNVFEKIYVQPAAGDAGGAIGAAYSAYHIYYENECLGSVKDRMKGSLLGPSFSSEYIEDLLIKRSIIFKKLESDKDLTMITANYLASGKIVGWFQGRMEFGPRALGNRSILGDPRQNRMKDIVNLKIKKRESFRPFAPAVLLEDVNEHFEMGYESPYMLLITPVKNKLPKPENFDELSSKEKFSIPLSEIPAVTHVDYTARVQTVDSVMNPLFHSLILDFKKITGIGVVLNTSFNGNKQPIVCSPEDALDVFWNTDLDILVLDKYIIEK